MKKFPSKVAEQLKFYVYLYIDPRTDQPFYIGKGKGNRAFSHLDEVKESDKVRLIKEIRDSGYEPKIELLKYGLTEKDALLVEATAIDLLDIGNLTNQSRGHGSKHGARAPVEEVIATLAAEPVEITEPAILINIKRGYRYGLRPIELYDQTRSSWRVGSKRDRAKYAMAVYKGVVREVYEITVWVPARSTMHSFERVGEADPKRWEFVGTIAPEKIRSKYKDRSVARYQKPGAQNPIMYVNCD